MPHRPIDRRLIVGIFFILVVFVESIAFAYTTTNAVNYANQWWNGRNPDFNTTYSSDCANFVSQCLIKGGMKLSQDTSIYTDTYGAIPSVSDLDKHLNEFQHAIKTDGHYAVDAPSNLTPGDVVIYKDDSGTHRHAAIVISGNGANAILAAHSGDHNDIGIDFQANYYFNTYGSVNTTFYHFPTSAERGHNQEFYGTGNYYGPSTLIFVVLGPSVNFEGYIVDCGDDTEQDLVVGEDTSRYSGCAHYIKGYCSDAHKGIPDRGITFGQPWTSNDPNHWAYWARRAVIYGNQNSYTSRDILEAVWYITDRSGSYNQILVGIGYAADGPDKNITGYSGGIPADSIKLVHNKFNPLQGERMKVYYRLSSAGAVKVALYTLDGALVTTLVNNPAQAAGTYSLTWDGRNDLFETVASGIYLVHIQGPGFKTTKKVCVIK